MLFQFHFYKANNSIIFMFSYKTVQEQYQFLSVISLLMHNGDLKSDQFKIQKHLKSGLFEDWILDGLDFKWFWTIQNPDVLAQISNGFWRNGNYSSKFQIVWLPNFRSHSKSRPFATQPLCDHLKSRLVRISDPHCISHLEFRLILISIGTLKMNLG